MSCCKAPDAIGPRQTIGVRSSANMLIDIASMPCTRKGTNVRWSRISGRLPSGTPSIIPWLGP